MGLLSRKLQGKTRDALDRRYGHRRGRWLIEGVLLSMFAAVPRARACGTPTRAWPVLPSQLSASPWPLLVRKSDVVRTKSPSCLISGRAKSLAEEPQLFANHVTGRPQRFFLLRL